METESRVAVIGIVVDQTGDTEELNKVLHQYGQYIVGRMVFPKQKDIKKQPMFTCLQTKEYCY